MNNKFKAIGLTPTRNQTTVSQGKLSSLALLSIDNERAQNLDCEKVIQQLASQSRRQSSRLRGGHAFIRCQSSKSSRNGAVFKRASMLNGETKHVDWGIQAPPVPFPSTGPVASAKARPKISIKLDVTCW